MTQEKKNGKIIAIITMIFLFGMISFVTNLAAPFGTIWRNEYDGFEHFRYDGKYDELHRVCLMGNSCRGNMLVATVG